MRMVSSGNLKGDKRDLYSLLAGIYGFFLVYSSSLIHCKALGVGLGSVFYLQDHGMATWKGMKRGRCLWHYHLDWFKQ